MREIFGNRTEGDGRGVLTDVPPSSPGGRNTVQNLFPGIPGGKTRVEPRHENGGGVGVRRFRVVDSLVMEGPGWGTLNTE